MNILDFLNEVLAGLASNLPLIVAVLALCVTWTNLARSHTNVLKWLRCDSHATNEGLPDHVMRSRFFIDIKNIGLPLHEADVAIRFMIDQDQRIPREMLYHLTRFVPNERRRLRPLLSGEFTKGMIGRFGLESDDDTDTHGMEWLGRLSNCRSQRAEIVVFSQGYEVKCWRVCTLRSRITHVVYRLLVKLEIRSFSDAPGRMNACVKRIGMWAARLRARMPRNLQYAIEQHTEFVRKYGKLLHGTPRQSQPSLAHVAD